MTSFKRVNVRVFNKYWCNLKHLVAKRELGIEYMARVARQVMENPDDNEDLILKMEAIALRIRDVEFLIEETMKKIFTEEEGADASTFRFDPEQFRRFLTQLGHIVCCEEHYTDHLTRTVLKLLNVKNEDEKKVLIEERNLQIQLLDATRLVRQQYINSMIEEMGEVVACLPE